MLGKTAIDFLARGVYYHPLTVSASRHQVVGDVPLTLTERIAGAKEQVVPSKYATRYSTHGLLLSYECECSFISANAAASRTVSSSSLSRAAMAAACGEARAPSPPSTRKAAARTCALA